MDLTIKGITEEEYGLWCNGGVTEQVNQEIIEENHYTTKIGFLLEDVKNFEFDLEKQNHIIFVKVHNDKTYDNYREHLITLIKMMIKSKRDYRVCIYIVSDKYLDYKNELTNFFNLNTHYEKKRKYNNYFSIIKCLSMRFIGFRITNSIILFVEVIFSLIKKGRQ